MPQQMSPDLTDIYEALKQQLLWIIHKWSIYVELFSEKETVDLLNSVSPPTFRTVQDALFADTVMTLARMSDPPRSAGKDNLSFQRLKNIVSNEFPGRIATSCSTLVDAFVAQCDPLRDLRNRQLAHSDLHLSLGVNSDPLPGISRKAIRSVLDCAVEILNQIAGDVLDSHILFWEIDQSFTVEGLVIALNLAKESRLKQLSDRHGAGRVWP